MTPHLSLMGEVEALAAAFERAVALDGLTGQQCLMILRLGDRRLAMKDLDGDVYYGTNVSYNVYRMVDRGLVLVDPDPEDRRRTIVSLTRRGRALCDRIAARAKELEPPGDGSIWTPDFFDLARSAIRRLRRAVER